MPPVAKAKKRKARQDEISNLMSDKAQKSAERAIRRQLADIDERADEYERYANIILDSNGDEIRESTPASSLR